MSKTQRLKAGELRQTCRLPSRASPRAEGYRGRALKLRGSSCCCSCCRPPTRVTARREGHQKWSLSHSGTRKSGRKSGYSVRTVASTPPPRRAPIRGRSPVMASPKPPRDIPPSDGWRIPSAPADPAAGTPPKALDTPETKTENFPRLDTKCPTTETENLRSPARGPPGPQRARGAPHRPLTTIPR